jgi:uncharacterized repeat protein (TIGR01451 family)
MNKKPSNYSKNYNFFTGASVLFVVFVLSFFITPNVVMADTIHTEMFKGINIKQKNNPNIVKLGVERDLTEDQFVCNSDPDEYVCNGDFESSYNTLNHPITDIMCGSWNAAGQDVPFWQSFLCPLNNTFIFGTDDSWLFFASSGINGNYTGNIGAWNNDALVGQLKQPLTSGHLYRLSFDLGAFADFQIWNQESIFYIFGLNLNPGFASGNISADTTLDQEIPMVAVDPATSTPPNYVGTDFYWYHSEQNFIANDDYSYLIIGSESFSYMVDNISIKDVSPQGCTNPQAINYNYLAILDDGSCILPTAIDISIKKVLQDGSLSTTDRNITWEISLVNSGSDEATNINVVDYFPQGLVYEGVYATPTGTFNVQTGGQSAVWNVPHLGANQSVAILITMKVPNSRKICGVKVNTAELVSLDQSDTDPSDNIAEASIKLNPCGAIILNNLKKNTR